MANIREYWATVRQKEGELPEDPYLISLESSERGMRGGLIVQASRTQAAKLIVDRSHRQATDEEISEHLASENHRRAAMHAEEMLSEGRATIILPAEAPRKKVR